MRWAAVNFETATRSRTSACALGLVIVEDGREVLKQSWLIRPPRNSYEHMNIQVHGIQPEHTAAAPAFIDVWNEAMSIIEDRPLVAHNAPFDIGVIRRCCETAQIELPQLPYFCTVQLARRTWPELGRYRLPVVADHIGATLQHHDALSDANVCSQVAQACVIAAGVESLDELAQLHQIRERLVHAA